ncbi:hypothetical protein QPK87_09855 [Kamptonema cortianum]|nr:hypothetical protein [Geitlerinema splendidum]MDK3156879.1 hypothetical protein [Kamptonema cortianum]
MKRSILTFGLVAATVLATAQAGHVQAMHGRGVAHGEHGNARFDFEVAKRPDTPARGRFEFRTVTEHPHRVITIKLHHVERFGTEGDKGRMSGPGLMVVKEGNHERRIQGVVTLLAHDAVHNPPRHGDDAGAKLSDGDLMRLKGDAGEHLRDSITVGFKSGRDHGNINYEYRGRVIRGFVEVRGAHGGGN